MRLKDALGVVLATATVAGCGGFKPPTALDHDARSFIALVSRNSLDSALAVLEFTGSRDTVRNQLAQGREFMSRYGEDSLELVGWNVMTMNDTRGTLTYETHGDAGWAILTVNVRRSGPTSRIAGFHWQATAGRLADLNAFTLSGRTAAHYLYLAMALISVVACIGGAIFAGVRRMGVVWVLFCLIGISKATINWTTGQQSFALLSFNILGAGCFRPGLVGPWFVTWSLPVGTILALLKWRAQRATLPPAPSVAA